MKIGLDIGGTKIEIVAFDSNHDVIKKKRVQTPNNYQDFILAIGQLVNDMESELGFKCSVGIGLPGTICSQTGLAKNSNREFMNGQDLLTDLQHQLDRKIKIANDADCFTLSEAMDGAAASGHIVFGVILGTGCGGGLVIDKKLVNGVNGITGEWGHNPLPDYNVESDGIQQRCYCGKNNCIERYISGSGFEMQYLQRFGQHKMAKEIITGMQNGELTCQLAYHQLVDQIARSFASIINMIDPDVIVVGGGLSNAPGLLDDINKHIPQYVFGDVFMTKIAAAKYGDSSGVRGAAWL